VNRWLARYVRVDFQGWEENSLTTTLSFVAPELFSLSSIGILGMERNVTLVEKRLCWSDALLYCRDFHWDLLSIRGPEEQEMVDELVADASFPLTSHLWVGLRRYWPGLIVCQTNNLSSRSSVRQSNHFKKYHRNT